MARKHESIQHLASRASRIGQCGPSRRRAVRSGPFPRRLPVSVDGRSTAAGAREAHVRRGRMRDSPGSNAL
ncbi:hypothetical protein BURPSPAST_J0740 [Burkholderia pseudomallei Pasteur 52237]|nr:hypothetical protein BURPSPAST_J0740 [Burkholderia pseudomallei Pasteur 52237]